MPTSCCALAEGADRAGGRRIDVSMLQAAAFLADNLAALIDLDCDPEEIGRWGNAHRKFIPTSVYPTSDGYIYIAVGSNAQWRRLTGIDRFVPVAKDGARDTPEARYRDREAIYREIGAATGQAPLETVSAELSAAQIPNTPINPIPQVHEMPAVRSKMTRTVLPTGQALRLQPRAVDLADKPEDFFPPRLCEDTRAVLAETGYSGERDDRMIGNGIAAGRKLALRGPLARRSPGFGRRNRRREVGRLRYRRGSVLVGEVPRPITVSCGPGRSGTLRAARLRLAGVAGRR